MGLVTAVEILELAVKLERNGAAYYRRAADLTPDSCARAFLRDLAAMEDRHVDSFQTMLRRVPPTVLPDPGAEEFLKTVAERRVFAIDVDPSEGLTGRESVPEILRQAIQLEKDSVVFYVAIGLVTPDPDDKDVLQEILQEELGHITLLADQLALHAES